MMFDRAGDFIKSWGEGVFTRPHGIHMTPDETILCTDDCDHSVCRLSLDCPMTACDPISVVHTKADIERTAVFSGGALSTA